MRSASSSRLGLVLVVSVLLLDVSSHPQDAFHPDLTPAKPSSELTPTKLTKQAASILDTQQEMEQLFGAIDSNGDGVLSTSERSHLARGDHTLLIMFDLDSNEKLTRREFMMAPLLMSFLEKREDLMDHYRDFQRGAVLTVDPAVQDFLKDRLTDLEVQMPPAPPSSQGTSFIELHEQEKQQQELKQPVESLLESMSKSKSKAKARSKDKVRSKVNSKMFRGVLDSLKKMAGGGKKDEGPKSEHGIPSVFDETCVLCQWLVQRMKSNIYQRLVDDPNMMSAPGGDVMMGGGLSDSFGDASPIDQTRVVEQAMARPGGKGIMRIIGQDTLLDYCSPRFLPELYTKTCKMFTDELDGLVSCIAYGFDAAAACAEVSLCDVLSYAWNPNSVHMPTASKIFNGARGTKCGFMGGIHESASLNFITKGLCHAKNAIKA